MSFFSLIYQMEMNVVRSILVLGAVLDGFVIAFVLAQARACT